MLDTSALKTATARLKADNTAMLAALTSVRDQNRTNAAALQDALEKLKAFPGDTSAIEADIAAVVTDLTQIADDTEKGVAENPAVPDMSATPPPA